MTPPYDLPAFVHEQLDGTRFAHLDEETLLAHGEGMQYTKVAFGFFFPDVAVTGQIGREERWSINRFVTSEHDTDPAYEQLRRMQPGDIARLSVDGTQYLAAAFTAPKPAKSLVILMKAPRHASAERSLDSYVISSKPL